MIIRKPQMIKLWTLTLVMVMLMTLISGCGADNDLEISGNYGSTGVDLARNIASSNHYRKAYSQGEQATAAFIKDYLTKLGYQPISQVFSGSGGQSENIVVQITGQGFYREPTRATDIAGQDDPKLQKGDFRRLVIVGAGYDTPIGSEQNLEFPNYDGISGNASGTAALLTLAEKLKNQRIGFDINLVFFGASSDNQRGSRVYLESLSDEQKHELESVFVIDSIFAGDKLYANAGLSAAQPEFHYDLRVPLYDLLKISVSYYTGIRILDNQAGYPIAVEGVDRDVIYREFTLQKGDHTPFDEQHLPVVYIESADYAVDQGEAFTENPSPAFTATNGKVRGTNFDNYEILHENLPEDLMEERLNTVAFVLLTYLQGGLINADVK